MDIKFKSYDPIHKSAASFGLSLRKADLFNNPVASDTDLVYKGYKLCGQLITNGNTYTLEVFNNVNTLHAFASDIEATTDKKVIFKIED